VRISHRSLLRRLQSALWVLLSTSAMTACSSPTDEELLDEVNEAIFDGYKMAVGDTLSFIASEAINCSFAGPCEYLGVPDAKWSLSPSSFGSLSLSTFESPPGTPSWYAIPLTSKVTLRANRSGKVRLAWESGKRGEEFYFKILPRITSFAIEPSSGTVFVGDTIVVVCKVVFENGEQVPDAIIGCDNPWASGDFPGGGPVATWVSNKTAPHGDTVKIIGRGPGRVEMSARVANRSARATIRVEERSVDPPHRDSLTLASVSTGDYHSCGLDPAGAAYCWGDNGAAQLGDGTRNPSSIPVRVAGGLTFTSITASGSHSCGVTSAGAAFCWGANDRGQLGDASTVNNRSSPVSVSGAIVFTRTSAGHFHTCGVTNAGPAYCWGHNANGALGDGSSSERLSPVSVAGGASFTAVSAGLAHTCGLTAEGVAYCWGDNNHGRLGDGTSTARSAPRLVATPLRFASVSAGASHTCGVTAAGAAYCWGGNEFGQLGVGSAANQMTPVAVAGDLRFLALSAGPFHSCGVTEGGAAYCWGGGIENYGQLGDGTTIRRETPVLVAGGLRLVTVSVGRLHSCGLTAEGAVYCWGANQAGQLGDGTRIDRPVPVRVLR
jgi:alpha-tubulin suppressor-like RCC1 family protein